MPALTIIPPASVSASERGCICPFFPAFFIPIFLLLSTFSRRLFGFFVLTSRPSGRRPFVFFFPSFYPFALDPSLAIKRSCSIDTALVFPKARARDFPIRPNSKFSGEREHPKDEHGKKSNREKGEVIDANSARDVGARTRRNRRTRKRIKTKEAYGHVIKERNRNLRGAADTQKLMTKKGLFRRTGACVNGIKRNLRRGRWALRTKTETKEGNTFPLDCIATAIKLAATWVRRKLNDPYETQSGHILEFFSRVVLRRRRIEWRARLARLQRPAGGARTVCVCLPL